MRTILDCKIKGVYKFVVPTIHLRSVFYIADTYASAGRVFLDPNTLSDDGTTAVTGKTFTHDGTLMAYALSEQGSDWTSVKVGAPDLENNCLQFKRVPSGEPLADELKGLKYSIIVFTRDGTGFFYNVGC